MIITIDGPGGSGKSTIAKKLAEKLKFNHIDTGAMYRAVAWFLKKEKTNLSSQEQVEKALLHCELSVQNHTAIKRYLVNEEDITKEIRSIEITNIVSIVAAIPCVREFLVQKQRQQALNSDVVCEGRDIGSVVFPNAEFKIYLDADPKIRAQRRYKELIEKFPEKKASFSLQTILDDIIRRDQIDSTRKHSPLVKPKNAFLIDTSNLSIEEIIDIIIKQYEKIKK